MFILLVNNYEVSAWEGFYLELWWKNKSTPYIDANSMLECLKLPYIPILRKYFSSMGIILLFLDNKVDISNFIEFLCIFVFFDKISLYHSI